jgi:hypothetical protein
MSFSAITTDLGARETIPGPTDSMSTMSSAWFRERSPKSPRRPICALDWSTRNLISRRPWSRVGEGSDLGEAPPLTMIRISPGRVRAFYTSLLNVHLRCAQHSIYPTIGLVLFYHVVKARRLETHQAFPNPHTHEHSITASAMASITVPAKATTVLCGPAPEPDGNEWLYRRTVDRP